MQNPFKLKADLPKTTRINRSLILGSTLLVAFILILAIVTSFSDTPNHSRAKKNSLAITTGTTGQPLMASDLMEKLPTDYQDIKKIAQFQTHHKNVELPPEVKQELAFLKQQQAMLQQRLSSMQTPPSSAAQAANSAMDKQAQNSNLFFPGTMPIPNRLSKPITKDAPATKSNQTPTANKQSAYEAQNMQSQKIKFLEPSDEAEDIYDLHNITKPISPYEVQGGTLIPAVLITSINTSLPGDAVAQVRQDIYDSVHGKFLLIPKGSKLLGQYDSKIAYGQRRVLIAFTRIIRPDGSSILLSKYTGADLKGQAGMEGLVDNHWMQVLSAATLSTILSVGTGLAADRSADTDANYINSKQGAILGAANNISQVGQNISSRAMNIQPTLVIPSGFEFNIIVRKDMVLTPYTLN